MDDVNNAMSSGTRYKYKVTMHQDPIIPSYNNSSTSYIPVKPSHFCVNISIGGYRVLQSPMKSVVCSHVQTFKSISLQ